MALNLKISTALAHAMLGSAGIGTAFDGGTLELRDGTQPTDSDQAATGNVLASLPLGTPAFAAPAGRQIVNNSAWQDASADATGTATWFRVKTSTDPGGISTTAKRWDGTVGVTTNQFNLVVNTANLVAGKPFSIDASAMGLRIP